MAKQSWSDIKKQLHEMDSADSAKRIQSRTNTAIRQQAAAYRPTPAETAAYQSAPANGRNDEDTSSVAARIKAAGQAQSEKADPLRSAAAEYVKNHPVGNGIVQKVSPSGSPIVDASGKTAYAPTKTFNESINTAKRESASRANDINNNWSRWLQLAQKDTLDSDERAEAKRGAALLSEQSASLRGQTTTKNPIKYIAAAIENERNPNTVSSADRQKATSYDEVAKVLNAKSSGKAAFAAGVAKNVAPWADKAMKADVSAINKAGYGKSTGLDENSQTAINNFYSNENAMISAGNKMAAMAGGIVGGIANASVGIGVADTALGGLKWYSNLSKPLQSAISSGTYFGAQGGVSAASNVPSEDEWNAYQAQQQKIAAEMGGSYTPKPYSPSALWGNVAKQSGISAASGAAFGYASAALGDIGKAVLAKHGLQTPFMEAVRNVTAATGGAAASEGVNYALQSGDQKPTKDEMVQNVATAFLLSALTSGVDAIETTRANKAAIDYAVQEMQNEYARTFSGTTTRAERAAALDHVTEYNDTIRGAISQHYYAGNQAYIDDVLQTLDAIDEQVGRIRASGIADTSIKLPEYRQSSETASTAVVSPVSTTAPAAQSETMSFPVVRPQSNYIQNGVLQEVNRSSVTRMASTLGEHGQKAMIAAYKGSDASVYSGDFIRAYNAGVKGADISGVQAPYLTPQQKFAAFSAGQNDAKVTTTTTYAKDLPAGETQNTGVSVPDAAENRLPAQETAKIENAAPVTLENAPLQADNEVTATNTETEVANNGGAEQQDDLRDRDGGRTVGQPAGGQAQLVETRAGAPEKAGPGSTQKETAAQRRAAVQTERTVSTADLGVPGGTRDESLRVVPEPSYDGELRSIAERNRAHGMETTFFTGTLNISDGTGSFTARGAASPDGKRMWVRVDHDSVGASQIAKHEEYHLRVQKDPTLNRKLRDAFVKKHGDGALEYLSEYYAGRYFSDENGNVTVPAEYIIEEVFADMYGGIDVAEGVDAAPVRATDYTDETRQEVYEIGQNSQTEDLNHEREKTAGGQYSRDDGSGGVDSSDGKAEDRRSFYDRSHAELRKIMEVGGVAYSYEKVPAYETSRTAVQIKRELTRLGIKSFYHGGLEYNVDGVTYKDPGNACAIGDKIVGIDKGAFEKGNGIDLAGHEAFHIWTAGGKTEQYISVLHNNFKPLSVYGLKAAFEIDDQYFKGKALPKDPLFVEEVYAHISGDLHAGNDSSEIRAAFKDYDAVKAAWERVVTENSAGGVRFSRDEETRQSAKEFSEDIDEWNANGRRSKETFILGSTGDILQGLGAVESDIYMQSSKIEDILEKHPEMTLSEIKRIPEILDNPILILSSRNVGRQGRANSRIILFGSVKAQNGKPVMAVLDLRPKENHLLVGDMQKVNSAYTKDNDTVSFIQNSEVLYADKNRTIPLLRAAGFQSPVALQQNGSIGSITYDRDTVNLTGVKFHDVVKLDGDNNVYSRDAADPLQEQNAALREKVDYWKGQTKRTAENTVRRADTDKIANGVLKEYDSSFDKDERRAVSDRVKELGDYLVGRNVSYEEAKDRALGIARDIVGSASVLSDSDGVQNYKAIRAYLKDTKLFLNDKSDIADFEDFRRRHFGKFTISAAGLPVDTAYHELSETFGEGYFPSDITHPSDQLLRIADVVDSMGPVYENPYSYHMAEASEYLANDILDQLLSDSVRQTAPTFADRQAAKLASTKAAGQQRVAAVTERLNERSAEKIAKVRDTDAERLDALRQQKNERIAQITEQGRERTKQALQRERAARDEKIARLKEKNAESRAKASEKRKQTELRGKIAKRAGELSQKLLNPTDKKHIPEELRGAVSKVLEAINLESGFDVGENGHVERGAGAPTKRTAAFAALREAYGKIGGDLVLDPDLMGGDGATGLLDDVIAMSETPIANMSLAQLTTVYDTLRAVDASVKTAGQMFSLQRWETVSDAAEALRKDNGSKTPPTEYKGISNAQKLARLDMLTPEAYFHRLGGSGDQIFRMLRNAQDKHILIMKAASDWCAANLKGIDVPKLEKEIHTVTLGGQKVRLSKAQLMELYVLYRREQAVNHIFAGGILPDVAEGKGIRKISATEPVRGITVDEITKALSLLTADEAKAAASMQRYLSSDMAEYGNQASMEVYDYRKFNEEYYWPIRTNRQEIRTTVEKDTQVTSVANKGMTKATVPNANTSLRIGSIFDSFSTHVSDMATYAAWLGTTEDVSRIINYTYRSDEGIREGTVKGIMANVFGRDIGEQYAKKLLSDISIGVHGAEQEYMGGITGNFKAAAVGANLRVIIQQPTAILRAMDMIDPQYLVIGTVSPLKGWNKALQYAPIAQWKDWGYFDVDTGRKMKDVLFGSSGVIEDLRQKAMWGAGMADSLAWGQLWNACEAETKATHKSLHPGSSEYYDHIAKRFTEIVDHTQVVDGILQRSQIMRSTSGLKKMATAFMGEPTKQYNMFMSAAYDAQHATGSAAKTAKQRLVRTLVALLVSGVVNAAAQSIMDAARDGDKNKDYWEKWMTSFFGFTGDEEGFTAKWSAFWSGNLESVINPAQYIVYAKDVVSILQGYDVTRMDMESIEKVYTSANNFMKSLSGEGKYTVAGASADLFSETARLLGLPVSNVKRDVLALAQTAAIQSKNYVLQYKIDRALLSLANNSGEYLDILYNAYNNDRAAYEKIYADMVKSGFEEKKIQTGMENREKKAEGVTKTEDLKNRFVSPEVEASYKSSLSTVTGSEIYSGLDDKTKKEVDEWIYQTATGTLPDSTQKKADAAAEQGIDSTYFVLYKAALKKYDDDKNGSTNQKEAQEAIDAIENLTEAQRSFLWKSTNKSWKDKNNPYS